MRTLDRGRNFFRRHGEKRKRGQRVALVTAIHGRPELTKKFMRYYSGGPELRPSKLYPEWRCDPPPVWVYGPMIAVGDGESNGFWEVFEAENVVSGRFNRAVAIALEDETVDGVMIVGSDDFMSRALIEAMLKKFVEGYDFVGCDGVYFYDALSERCRFVPVLGALGAGRLLSRELLERLDGMPYKPGLMKRIDMSMVVHLNYCP